MRFQFLSLIFSMGLITACNGFKSLAPDGGSANRSASVAPAIDMNKIKLSVASAKVSVANAQQALGTIFNPDGTFNWDVFTGGVDFSTLGAKTQTCLNNAFPNNPAILVLTAPADIAVALKCILDDVVTVATAANTDLTSAISLLQSSLATATTGSAQAQEIQAMITQVQSLQTEYMTTLKTMSTQLSVVTTFLNQLPTLATGAIPIPVVSLLVGMTISSYVQPITTEINLFQSQIAAI
ncbi:MAG: hypothetical protein C5B49_13700 [Bdellovibrio sp.]|nr:MAG: hypothetical protein C5B49_13700 [Bdellovibrio sp.]